MKKLTVEIGKKAADVPEFAEAETKTAAGGTAVPSQDQSVDDTSRAEAKVKYPDPPVIVCRDVVATMQKSEQFGHILACRCWELGYFGAQRKAYVGDGSSWIWTIYERQFKAFGFTPILDFIHALTYIYAAAMAGRTTSEGWPIYTRWITWAWQGKVSLVLTEMKQRQQELGLPTDGDGETSPRVILAKSVTYLTNQQSRMNYPEYRRQGLPITSSHIESTNKLLNQRVKGTDKFWSRRGAEAMLQLRADVLSLSKPLEAFWRNRPDRMTGRRNYQRSAA